jgi:hypothetical protein
MFPEDGLSVRLVLKLNWYRYALILPLSSFSKSQSISASHSRHTILFPTDEPNLGYYNKQVDCRWHSTSQIHYGDFFAKKMFFPALKENYTSIK